MHYYESKIKASVDIRNKNQLSQLVFHLKENKILRNFGTMSLYYKVLNTHSKTEWLEINIKKESFKISRSSVLIQPILIIYVLMTSSMEV